MCRKIKELILKEFKKSPVAYSISIISFFISLWSCSISKEALRISLWESRAHLVVLNSDSQQRFLIKSEPRDKRLLLNFQLPVKNHGNSTAQVTSSSLSVRTGYQDKLSDALVTPGKSIYYPPQQEFPMSFSYELRGNSSEEIIKLQTDITNGSILFELTLNVNYKDMNSNKKYQIETMLNLNTVKPEIISYKEK